MKDTENRVQMAEQLIRETINTIENRRMEVNRLLSTVANIDGTKVVPKDSSKKEATQSLVRELNQLRKLKNDFLNSTAYMNYQEDKAAYNLFSSNDNANRLDASANSVVKLARKILKDVRNVKTNLVKYQPGNSSLVNPIKVSNVNENQTVVGDKGRESLKTRTIALIAALAIVGSGIAAYVGSKLANKNKVEDLSVGDTENVEQVDVKDEISIEDVLVEEEPEVKEETVIEEEAEVEEEVEVGFSDVNDPVQVQSQAQLIVEELQKSKINNMYVNEDTIKQLIYLANYRYLNDTSLIPDLDSVVVAYANIVGDYYGNASTRIAMVEDLNLPDAGVYAFNISDLFVEDNLAKPFVAEYDSRMNAVLNGQNVKENADRLMEMLVQTQIFGEPIDQNNDDYDTALFYYGVASGASYPILHVLNAEYTCDFNNITYYAQQDGQGTIIAHINSENGFPNVVARSIQENLKNINGMALTKDCD